MASLCKFAVIWFLDGFRIFLTSLTNLLISIVCRILALTSFPFRILQATRGFNRITGRDVVGECFYETFQNEGPLRPAVGTTPNPPLGISKVLINGSRPSRIQVFPVVADPTAVNSGLLYYGVIIQELGEEQWSIRKPQLPAFIVLN
jgi:hypothetical protein